MANEEKVKEIIADVLNVPMSSVEDDLAVGDIPEWDSLRHLTIISTLAKEFSIEFSREELVEIEDVSDIVNLVVDKIDGK